MRTGPDNFYHLTYCTNIHSATGWPAVRANLERFGPALKAHRSPDAPFGLGLRISAMEARELLDGQLDSFKTFLDREGLYVALINGFPYGPFHRTAVKANVYAPDWRERARVDYTLDLITILTRLLPDGVDGGVSTVPLSYKDWMDPDNDDDWLVIVEHLVVVAHRLLTVRRETGQMIHLDIEPEPDCTLETTTETIDFFERRLLSLGAPRLSAAAGISIDDARAVLLDHIQVCFDCCHFSVGYEDPVESLLRFRRAGIAVGRIQLSSALRSTRSARPSMDIAMRLRAFADATYLHQVVERRRGSLTHYPDLLGALDCGPGDADEWRIHFHVPLFASDYDGLSSTQDDVKAVLSALRSERFTRHLEIETYTWSVLPTAVRPDLLESIRREYDWVLDHLVPPRR